MSTTKVRKRSEYRTIAGAKKIKNTSEEVTKNVAAFINYSETVQKYIAAGIFKNEAEAFTGNKDGLKIIPPNGSTDLALLRKQIRMAILRPEVIVDAIKLVKIATLIAEMVSENDILVRRENITRENQNEDSTSN